MRAPRPSPSTRVALPLRVIELACACALPLLMSACAHAAKPEAPPATVVDAKPEAAAAPAPAAAAPTKSMPDDLDAILAGAALRFDFDRADLTDESTRRLQRVADALRSHPGLKVKISGHCDERGTQEYNFALGQQRAQAARGYLVNLGIPPDRVETVSFGAESPADPGHDDQAWSKNRRDELSRQP